MAGFVDAEERRLLDLHLSGGYIALLSAVTDAEAGTGTEITGDAYVRKAVSGNIGASSTTSGTTTATNGSIIRWDSLDSTNSKTVAGIAIYSASTAGTMRSEIALTGGSVTVAGGQPFEVPVAGLTLSLD